MRQRKAGSYWAAAAPGQAASHRVVDGHEAVAFCYEVIKYLEDPGRLVIQMV